MSAKQVFKVLERSSERQSVEGRPSTNKEWLVLLQKLDKVNIPNFLH